MRQMYKFQSESKGPRTRSDSDQRQEKLDVLAQAESKLSLQFSSAAQPCLTLCDPKDCNTPGFPVHHQLLELTQTHVPAVSDVILQSHFLSSPSPPIFNLSQHQGLFMLYRFPPVFCLCQPCFPYFLY